MEWVDASAQQQVDVVKHKYANWKQIEEKYGHVVGCRYRVSGCRDSRLYGKCCHTCDKEETCKYKCLSTVEDCESKFPEGVSDAENL